MRDGRLREADRLGRLQRHTGSPLVASRLTIRTRAGSPSAANNAAVAAASSSLRAGAASGAQHEIGSSGRHPKSDYTDLTNGSGGVQPAHAKREEQIRDAVRERDQADPDHEQDRLVPEVPRRPEAQQQLDRPDDEPDPPGVDLVPRGQRHDDVEGALHDEEEAHHRSERPERVARVRERQHGDHQERQRKRDPGHLPPARRGRDVGELGAARTDHHHAEEIEIADTLA